MPNRPDRVLHRFMLSASAAAVATMMSMLVMGVMALDVFTGAEISLTPFYLVPLSLASWYGGGRWPGLLVSITTGICWFVGNVDLDHGSKLLWSAANSLIWLCIFITASLILVRLREVLNREQSRASTDYLTGVGNMRSFYRHLQRVMSQSRRDGAPYTLAYIDLDNFKLVNDSLGHLVGDDLLRVVAETLTRCTRAGDLIARLGGDEFAVVLVGMDTAEATGRLMAIRANLLADMQEHSWKVTFSIGAVTFHDPHDDPEEVVHIADDLMYTAKRQGKDTIVHMEDTELAKQP